MSAVIVPVHKEETFTTEDAGFVTTAASYRFFIGTTKGLFIPPTVPSKVRITTFRNPARVPDLHAVIEGWHELDLGASVSISIFSSLSGTVAALDTSHLSNLSGVISSFSAHDLGATLTKSGGISSLLSSVTTQGKVSDISAVVTSSVDPLAFNVVAVSTVPVKNLGALINYGTVLNCASSSAAANLQGYVRPLFSGAVDTVNDLSADLNVLRLESPLVAEVVGRKRTRIRILSLTFRSKIRGSERMRASIAALVPTSSTVYASIFGLSHEANLSASLDPIRFPLVDAVVTLKEQVANLDTGDVKDILVQFRSKVSSYVYDSVSKAVYATDRGSWVIDLRTTFTSESFFDRSPNNREVSLDKGLQEFYSLDEALRNAIVLLCDRRQEVLGASLSPRGMVHDFACQVAAVTADRLFNLATSVVPVVNSPDITASVSGALSGFEALVASVLPLVSGGQESLGGSVISNIVDNLQAEVVAV